MRLASWRRVLQALAVCFPYLGTAQFPPEREGITTVPSRFHHGVSISYKEPGICETTPGVRSYSGYVHLPPGTLIERGEQQDYPINTFFWFFEARKSPETAPLAIWLNGGPGGSSLFGALMENGPCFVGGDSNSTYSNPWSWNNEVNILYIDQPNQVGFSYGSLQNITLDLLFAGDEWAGEKDPWQPADFSDGIPTQNDTFLVGTYPSGIVSHTANSTNHSAIALWHFAQTWFAEFPAYKPADNRISVWSESYGGHYGPAIANFFMHQNEKITSGELQGSGLMYLHLDTVGIINGCVDSLIQNRAYADFGHHNTYGIQAFNDSEYENLVHELEAKDGIDDQLRECHRLARELDPTNIGNNDVVNKQCALASAKAEKILVEGYFKKQKHGWFDITHPFRDPFYVEYLNGYLNQHWVQKALGVPLNYSTSSSAVATVFTTEGDMARGGGPEELAYILDHGVKVTLVYGDRDYACNWIGGEKVSIAIPSRIQDGFSRAGYAPLAITSVYSGGQTRQYGNLSFSRIYQAGHMVPAYQPETAYQIFLRATFNKDIATGRESLHDDLSTSGPNSTWHHLTDVLPGPEPICYVRTSTQAGCSEEQLSWLRDGTAIVKDWIVVGRKGKPERAGLVIQE